MNALLVSTALNVSKYKILQILYISLIRADFMYEHQPLILSNAFPSNVN